VRVRPSLAHTPSPASRAGAAAGCCWLAAAGWGRGTLVVFRKEQATRQQLLVMTRMVAIWQGIKIPNAFSRRM